MEILERVDEVRKASRTAKAGGKAVALVPTMGYLHRGHLELVRRGRELAGHCVVSIFVNPTQFGPNEDLEKYPRDLTRDAELCREAGVDVVFAPPVAEIYPKGFQTYVTVEELSRPLCGARRPGHFRGVATVVAKLFHAVEPDVALFGEKDYQQLQVILRMVRDLDMAVRVEGVPTVREPDGLALSSRNAYLKGDERRRALALFHALQRAQDLVTAGERRADSVLAGVEDVLREAGARVDYAELRHPTTLEGVERIGPRTLLALAAYVGNTRLIDNRILTAPEGRGEEA
jgi:pantoate--beta-alanine ligase